MHGLECPYQLARRRAQGNDGIGVAVVPESQHAVIVRGGAARRDEHEVALRVCRERRPCVRAAALVRQLASPLAVGGIALLLRYRIPRPAELAGSRIEAPHFAACRVRAAVVADRRTGDDDAVDDDWGRRHRVRLCSNGGMRRPALRSTIPATPNPEHSAPSRASTAMSWDCAVATKIRRRHAAPAAAASSSHVDTPRGEISIGHVTRDLWIEYPAFPPSGRIERDDASERRADIHRVVYDQRRRLERGSASSSQTPARLRPFGMSMPPGGVRRSRG